MKTTDTSINTINIMFLSNLLLGILLVLIVGVFDMAHHFIAFEYGVAKEYIFAIVYSALLTIPGRHPSTDHISILFLSGN